MSVWCTAVLILLFRFVFNWVGSYLSPLICSYIASAGWFGEIALLLLQGPQQQLFCVNLSVVCNRMAPRGSLKERSRMCACTSVLRRCRCTWFVQPL
jgi:hypothetical protein